MKPRMTKRLKPHSKIGAQPQEQLKIKELIDMAKTIERNIKGITAFWRNSYLTNASMEGFNNKIRWLIRQAYGYRDEEYFHLKIFDLPHIKTQRKL